MLPSASLAGPSVNSKPPCSFSSLAPGAMIPRLSARAARVETMSTANAPHILTVCVMVSPHRDRLEQVDHIFAAVFRIADQTLVDGIDNPVHIFQWNEPNQHRAVVREFQDIARTKPALHG